MFAKHPFGVKYQQEQSSRRRLRSDQIRSLSHPLSRLNSMTAAFAPAPQTRFVPRTLALVPETVPNGGMQPSAVVPSSQSGHTASIATVHSLPVLTVLQQGAEGGRHGRPRRHHSYSDNNKHKGAHVRETIIRKRKEREKKNISSYSRRDSSLRSPVREP